MARRRLAAALAAAAAVILSAPFVQQALTAASTAWPAQFRALAIAATAAPVALAVLAAVVRIRDRRPLRYLALILSLAIGAGYIVINALSFTESFHFAEYGLLAWLFYRAVPADDGSVILLPLLAGIGVGIVDEWFQWFIPIRAGEARDIALNAAASGCGLLFALSVEPPRRLTLALRRPSDRARQRVRRGNRCRFCGFLSDRPRRARCARPRDRNVPVAVHGC